MGTTLADMRGIIAANLGGAMGTDYDISMPAVLLNTYINQALKEIDAEADWPWNVVVATLTTSSGTHLYTPPAGWTRTLALVDPNRGSLEFVSIEAIGDSWYDPTEVDAFPYWYTEAGGQLDIRPTPNGAIDLTHTYYAGEVDLVDDADEPLLPERFRNRVTDKATAFVCMRNENWGRYDRFQSRDEGHQRRMRDEKRRVKATSGVHVRGGTWVI